MISQNPARQAPAVGGVRWTFRSSWLLAGGAFLIAASALLAQSTLPLSGEWAALDGAAHAGLAVGCCACLARNWGARPLFAALLAGTLIDLDHAVAARSIDPAAMMSLSARPWTHSPLGALLTGAATTAIAGRAAGYAAGLAVLTHLVLDACAWPGVPLFAPLGGYSGHVLLTPSLAVVALAALVVLNELVVVALASRRVASDQQRRM